MKTYICFPGGKSKALTMSYDDGRLQDERLLHIFNQYGIKGTFNLNYGLMDQPQRISKDKIRELYQGHEIATHTMTHPTIARCPLSQVAVEILEDRKGLEAITGSIVRGHAYPNGSYSPEIEELFSLLGIAYGRTVETKDDFALPENLMEWKATCHHNDPTLLKKAQWFLDFQKKQYLKLFYVWGHSYEFDNDQNWEVIEQFCAMMGGREDIWYATNGEIAEFIEVKNRLQFSASGEMVYNPSAASAWLAIDQDRIVEVKGGELVKLQ
jgi:peptidoglycan/xylan/chitin deacetylase (PgdA/CDA1 family)